MSFFTAFCGIGFNFLSQSNLEALAVASQTVMPASLAKNITYDVLVNPLARFDEQAVVTPSY